MLELLRSLDRVRDRVPDNYKKYLTLIGGVCIHISLGSFYTFGNMFPYIISYLRAKDGSGIRYADGIWFEVVFSSCQALTVISVGQLLSRFKWNMKLVLVIGCIVNSTSVFITYFSIQSGFFLTLVTYSIINGASMGIGYILPLEYGMGWFPERKGLANSAILFGYGASSMIFSEVQTQFINPKNYSPDEPYDQNHPNEKYFSLNQADMLERVPKIFIILSICYASLQLIGVTLIFKVPRNDTVQRELVSNNEDDVSVNNPTTELSTKNSLGVDMNDPDFGLTLKEVVKLPAYWILAFMFILTNLGPTFSVSFYKVFGQEFINNDKFFATVNAVSSVFNSTGRFFWGYLVDRLPYKICYLILSSIVITMVSTMYLQQFIKIKEVYLLWICIIFFAQCGNYILTPTVTAKMFGTKNFTTIYGSLLLFMIPTSLFKAGVSELQTVIGWFWMFTIGALFMVLGSILALFFNVKNHKNKDI